MLSSWPFGSTDYIVGDALGTEKREIIRKSGIVGTESGIGGDWHKEL
nr:MAG TPA_asm: hypothetical protein [Caudoviricetes sp.]